MKESALRLTLTAVPIVTTNVRMIPQISNLRTEFYFGTEFHFGTEIGFCDKNKQPV